MTGTPDRSGDTPRIVLALDFDGVLCEGTREYFESSRRALRAVWPEAPAPGDDLLPAFAALRPVIEHGWEMPVLLRAIAEGVPAARLEAAWPAERDGLLARDPRGGPALADALRRALDDVRRAWIASDRDGWLAHHRLYSPPGVVRRVVAPPARTVIVTTKEGEFTRALLDHWGIAVAGVQGKEAGAHKCDALRALLAGGAPRLHFVEDRLETLRCAASHPELNGVHLHLAEWGYTTAAARDAARRDPRIRPLSLAAFEQGPDAW